MKRFLIAAVFASGVPGGAAWADALSEHTFLLAWASKSCAGLDYAPDLLRHAMAEVQSRPQEEVRAMATTLIGGLDALHDGNQAEMCETAIFMIENPDED